MPPDSNPFLFYFAVASTIPWICTPVILLFALRRLWAQTKDRAYAILAGGCLCFIFSGLLSWLSMNIPRFGKTPEEVARAVDIGWLKVASTGFSWLFIWVVFFGAISLLRNSRSAPPA